MSYIISLDFCLLILSNFNYIQIIFSEPVTG